MLIFFSTLSRSHSFSFSLCSGQQGYPGAGRMPSNCSEKEKLWDLLNVEKNINMTLTSSYAMLPTASVSGWYFANPDAKYFGVAKIVKAIFQPVLLTHLCAWHNCLVGLG
jgi:hypothetical protein